MKPLELIRHTRTITVNEKKKKVETCSVHPISQSAWLKLDNVRDSVLVTGVPQQPAWSSAHDEETGAWERRYLLTVLDRTGRPDVACYTLTSKSRPQRVAEVLTILGLEHERSTLDQRLTALSQLVGHVMQARWQANGGLVLVPGAPIPYDEWPEILASMDDDERERHNGEFPEAKRVPRVEVRRAFTKAVKRKSKPVTYDDEPVDAF